MIGRLTLCVSLALLGFPVPGASQVRDLTRDLLPRPDGGAYMLFPPRLVVGESVKQMVWSPNSKLLVLVRKGGDLKPEDLAKPPKESQRESTYLYDKATRQTRKLIAPFDGVGDITVGPWLGDSQAFIVTFSPGGADDGRRFYLARTDAKWLELANMGLDQQNTVMAQAGEGLAFVSYGQGADKKPRLSIKMINSRGQISNEIAPPPIPNLEFVGPAFLGVDRIVMMYGDRTKNVSRYYELTGSGAWKEISDKQAFSYLQVRPEMLQPLFGPSIASNGKAKTSGTSLWLKLLLNASEGPLPDHSEDNPKDDRPGVLVAMDADRGYVEVASDSSAVAYLANGEAYVREIASISKQAYHLSVKRREKSRAVEVAQQVGKGLLMYTSDYDDILPQDDISVLEPYLKDSELLAKFMWTYRGDRNLNAIRDPATTVMGYVAGPNGKAYLYADGHVVWKDDE